MNPDDPRTSQSKTSPCSPLQQAAPVPTASHPLNFLHCRYRAETPLVPCKVPTHPLVLNAAQQGWPGRHLLPGLRGGQEEVPGSYRVPHQSCPAAAPVAREEAQGRQCKESWRHRHLLRLQGHPLSNGEGSPLGSKQLQAFIHPPTNSSVHLSLRRKSAGRRCLSLPSCKIGRLTRAAGVINNCPWRVVSAWSLL